ncbi:hypothetical protein J6590_033362 [Homalodisca vitripennis]|nr:hypothetical protein J6590_033362 [Homalodisca vitripennis]
MHKQLLERRGFDGIRDRRGIRGRSYYGWTDATPRQCDMALSLNRAAWSLLRDWEHCLESSQSRTAQQG